MSTELVLLIGLQGSGKSSFYRERFAATHLHVSKDLWPNARRREARQQRLVEEALARGQSVVVDNTQPRLEDRAPLLRLGQVRGARRVGYFFKPDLKACLARNAGRVGRARVADGILCLTLRDLCPPSYAEGFDVLFHVELTAEHGFLVTPWRAEDESQ